MVKQEVLQETNAQTKVHNESILKDKLIGDLSLQLVEKRAAEQDQKMNQVEQQVDRVVELDQVKRSIGNNSIKIKQLTKEIRLNQLQVNKERAAQFLKQSRSEFTIRRQLDSDKISQKTSMLVT